LSSRIARADQLDREVTVADRRRSEVPPRVAQLGGPSRGPRSRPGVARVRPGRALAAAVLVVGATMR